jgi:hypothetical protein
VPVTGTESGVLDERGGLIALYCLCVAMLAVQPGQYSYFGRQGSAHSSLVSCGACLEEQS